MNLFGLLVLSAVAPALCSTAPCAAQASFQLIAPAGADNWVKAHDGHPENERADELARAGMAPFKE